MSSLKSKIRWDKIYLPTVHKLMSISLDNINFIQCNTIVNMWKLTLLCLLSLTALKALADSITIQQGVNGYTSGKSVDISTMYGIGEPGAWNDNGSTFGDGDASWCIGLLTVRSSYGYDISPLMRFDDLDQVVPAGAYVTKATLTLNVFADRPGAKLIGRYLNVDWYAGDTMAGGKGICGWRYRKEGVQWSMLGAMGEGTDLIADVNFVMPSTGTIPESDGPVSIDLDPSIVQTWIDTPSKNYGFKLQADVQDVHISLVQMQNKDYQGVKTPKLTIEYTTGPAPPRPAPSNTPITVNSPASGSNSPATGSNSPSSKVGGSSDASKVIGSGLVLVAGLVALL